MKSITHRIIESKPGKMRYLNPPVLWVHLALGSVIVLALALCLWLFYDISATRAHFQYMLPRSSQDAATLERLRSVYREEIWLELLQGLLILVLGCVVLVVVSVYFKVVQRFRDVRSMDKYIIRSITRGVLTIDDERRVTSCNRAMNEILGLCSEECYLQPVETLFAPDDPIRRMILSVLNNGDQHEEEEEEINYERPNGNKLPLRVTISALRNEEGRSIGNILLVKDLSPIRFLEERLRRQERLAALGHLTRRIIHEIRNPLSAMDMNLQLLAEHLERKSGQGADEKASRYFHIVFSELSRLDSILENTHLSVDTTVSDRSLLDLHEVIREVDMKMEGEVARSGHELHLELADVPARILGNANLLIQVFMNLLKNSLEALPSEHGAIHVRSRLVRKGRILIEIEDNGRGIDWQDLPRIFDPYFTTKTKGRGLGLSIVHNIVTQHDGDIYVGSWVGEGTLFELYFPLYNAGESRILESDH